MALVKPALECPWTAQRPLGPTEGTEGRGGGLAGQGRFSCFSIDRAAATPAQLGTGFEPVDVRGNRDGTADAVVSGARRVAWWRHGTPAASHAFMQQSVKQPGRPRHRSVLAIAILRRWESREKSVSQIGSHKVKVSP